MKKTLLLLCTFLCSLGMWAQSSETSETIASFTYTKKGNTVPTGWTGKGTGLTSTGNYLFICSDGSLTSPSINFNDYSSIKITVTVGRYGNLSGSKATVAATVGSTQLGTVDGTGTTPADQIINVTTMPTGSKSIVFTCTNATSTSHGARITAIKIEGAPKNSGSSTTYSVKVADNIAGGSVSASATSATEGSTVTLTATPDDGYKLSSWNVTNASTSATITVTDNKFTMPAANVNVSATFVEKTKYTISWSVNGTVTNTQDFYEGADIEFPTNVANPVSGNSKAFAGWLESTSIGDEPVFVTSAKATATKTYYAVFANKIAGSERLVKITNITNVTPGTYALICYDEKTYVSNAAATSSCPLQATVQKEQDEIIITDDMMWTVTKNDVGGYNIESVVEKGKFLWGGSANDGTRVTATSGKANAKKTWFAIADNTYGVVLYNEASDPQKRYLATNGTNDWRNYTSMSSTQKPANLYKLESAIIYKNHTTTIESAPSSTNLNAKGYASFSSDYELSIAEGAKAYTATVDEKAMTITWNAIEDDIIPANEGVLLKGDASAEVTFAVSATNKANIVSNNMIPNLVAKTKSELGDYIYVLSGENIIRLSESGIVGANKAYLRLSKYITEAEASEAKTFTMIWNDSNVVTGINNVNVNTKSTNVYNLAGQRVNANVKGIVIMDGKKYINK